MLKMFEMPKGPALVVVVAFVVAVAVLPLPRADGQIVD